MVDSLLSVLLMGLFPLKIGVMSPMSLDPLQIAVASPYAYEEKRRIDQSLLASVSASGVLVVDLTSGQRLYEYASAISRPMASLTKLMTALIIAENHELDEWVTVPEHIGNVVGNTAYLPPGGVFTVGDILSALLVQSGNDAAYTLSLLHSGSEAKFVDEMNTRARELGLRNTSFANATGLDASNHLSTPEDLTWLAMHVLRSPALRNRMSMRGVRITSRNGDVIYLTHTNALMHANIGVIAGKTGTTGAARECLFSVVQKNGREYGVVLLHSLNRYADMRKVLAVLDTL